MGLLANVTAALLGRSAYASPPAAAGAFDEIDSPNVESIRRAMGGQLQLQTHSQTRWYLADLEFAEILADGGQLVNAARLMRAARRDGVLAGVLSTRTDGLVRLPKKFIGDAETIKALEVGHNNARSVFDEMFPPTELALLAADGVLLGVGVAELVPVEGRDHPVMVRLDPEFLVYRWSENRWYFRSVAGLLHITPGDGRWILHTPGGRMVPWQHGLWRCIGRAFIRKEHAQLHSDNWEGKLANAARVAVSPHGAGEAQKEAWFQRVMAWGVNTVFGLTPGFDVRLLESNGRGWESFTKTVADQNSEMIIAVAGQTVTVDGGSGFQNSDIHKSIRADLIKGTADGLAYTLNTQGIPAFIALHWGDFESIESRATIIEWDVTPPKDRNSEATSMVTTANAIKLLTEALAVSGLVLDAPQLCQRFSIPLIGDPAVDTDSVGAAQGKPTLRLLQGGAAGAAAGGAAVGGEAGEVPAAATQLPAEKAAQDTALNGAQIASMLVIVTAVAEGQIPRDAGIAMVKRAFLVDDAGAEELMGSVGCGFVPKTAGAAPEVVSPAAPAVEGAAA